MGYISTEDMKNKEASESEMSESKMSEISDSFLTWLMFWHSYKSAVWKISPSLSPKTLHPLMNCSMFSI